MFLRTSKSTKERLETIDDISAVVVLAMPLNSSCYREDVLENFYNQLKKAREKWTGLAHSIKKLKIFHIYLKTEISKKMIFT